MLKYFVPLLVLSSSFLYRVEAQSGTISVGPLLTCDLTTFTCPGTSGCCTSGGCCGGGCCALGYTCINEGTASEACCDSYDLTKCGTVAAPSNSPLPSGSQCRPCTGIQNCNADGDHWTCLLGATCGFSYGSCYPCPYIGGCPSSAAGSSESSSPTATHSSGSSSSPSSSSSSSSPSSSSSSSAVRARDAGLRHYWLAIVAFGCALHLALDLV